MTERGQPAELAVLRRLLVASHGTFSLSIAVCNSPVLRDSLIVTLREAFPQIELVTVPPGTTDVFGLVASVAADAGRDAMFVVGLENSVPSMAREQPTLRSLNASRELWEGRFTCPVVLWLPEYAIRLLASHARDLWRYRSHVFEFSQGEVAAAPPGTNDVPQTQFGATAALDSDERLSRIAMLRQRLADVRAGTRHEVVAQTLGWLSELAQLHLSVGDLDESQRVTLELVEAHVRANDVNGLATAYGTLGVIARARGDLSESERMFQQALAAYEMAGRTDGIAATRTNLGLVLEDLGRFNDAERAIDKAIVLNKRLGRSEGLAVSYGNLGRIYQKMGRLTHAELMHREALKIYQSLSRVDGVAASLANLGAIHLAMGDLRSAEGMLTEAAGAYQQLGQPQEEAAAREILGQVHALRGEFARAREFWAEARGIYQRIGLPGKAQALAERLTSAEHTDARPARP